MQEEDLSCSVFSLAQTVVEQPPGIIFNSKSFLADLANAR